MNNEDDRHAHRSRGTRFRIGWTRSVADGARFRFTEDDAGDIIGNVQKPEVTVVISRENLNKAYELDLEESFLQRIVDAVEEDPF